jgi:hypothetical protein
MFNRYVDGLATIAPDDPAVYAAGAQRLVMEGYLAPPAEPEREGSTSHCGYAHTIIATPALGAITMLPARRQESACPNLACGRSDDACAAAMHRDGDDLPAGQGESNTLSGCCVSSPTRRSRTGSRAAMSLGVSW